MKSRRCESEGASDGGRGGDLGFFKSHPWAGESSERIQSLEPSKMKEGESSQYGH